MAALNISVEDIDALARIAYAEAERIARDTGDERAAYASVVDAVLNRVAANQPHYGGSTIQRVIDWTNDGKSWQFEPIERVAGHSWRNLKQPPKEVYDTVWTHLSDLQRRKANVVGKATHFLNPDTSGKRALRGWAKDWRNWPAVGIAPWSHRFGSADPGVVVPDYSVSFQPHFPPAPPPPPEGASLAEQSRYYGLTRALAPRTPVDREFHTPLTISQRMAETGGIAGILGLDGRLAIEHGVPPFERGTLRAAERWASAKRDSVGSGGTSLASAEIPVPTPKPLPQRSPDLMWSGGMMLEPPAPGSWTDFYANIPSIEERERFVEANPNPFLLERSKLAALDPDMRRIVRRAQEIAGTRFVVGSGVRSREQQAQMVDWGWSKTMNSDHVNSNKAVDLWPVDDNWAVTFDPARQDMIVAAMRQAADELGYDIDVGADWKNRDMPHFALKGRAQQRTETQPFELPLDNAPVPTPRPQRFGGMPGVGNAARAYAERGGLAPADRIDTRIDGAFGQPASTSAEPDVVSRLVASASRRSDPASFRVGEAFAAAANAPAVTTDPAALAAAVTARRADLATTRIGQAFSVAGAPQALNPGAPAAIARLRAEHAARMAPAPQATATGPRLPAAAPGSILDAYAQYAASRMAGPVAKAEQDRLAAARAAARTGAARSSVKEGATMPYTGGMRMPAPHASGAVGALERLAANPISLGQAGGKYAGSGLSAMMGVRSGMAPVGTVARSASNPDVTAVSLPHGNVAHMNSKYGYISTWSPADDDERGTVYGKALAIDPTGKHYGYYSPAKAQELASRGWSVFGSAAMAGKSTAAAGPSRPGPSGLAGFLSGLFGPGTKSPLGMAAANVAASRQAAPQQGLGGFLSGLLGTGPSAGGLGGAFSGNAGARGGGTTGGGMGGLGEDYGGL